MKNMKYIQFLLLGLLLSACGNGFFDLEPSTEVSTDKIYQTASDFNIAVLGCYAKLQSQTSFYFECCEYRSDNLTIAAPTAGTQDRYDIDQFKEAASNGILETYWANFNNEVYRCNLILEKIDNATFNETLKKQYKAEAMFLRAYAYFNMYRMWGGVPITRTVVSPIEAIKVKRATAGEMYDLIAGDLKNIVDNNMLPASYSGDNIGRITSGAAESLLGKVYLTFGKYQEAADVLKPLLGKYELLTDPVAVFSVDNKMNKEIIFAVRFNKSVVDEGHGSWFSVSSLKDDSEQSGIFKSLYSKDDLRKNLMKFVKVPGVNVYLLQKFYDTPDAITNNYGNDQIILRYPDVLLMYAEALNEVGYDASSSSAALNALNQVHQRAGLTALTAKDVPDKDSFKKAILLERQKEFPYEGQRWFDLVRMGGAKEAMAKQGFTIEDYQLVYPIPTAELERVNDKSILWQNTGY